MICNTHNEQITDQLSPSSTNLSIRDHPSQGVHIDGLREVVVCSAQGMFISQELLSTINSLSDAFNVYMAGRDLTSALTSSSHAVLTLSLERTSVIDGITSSRFHLAELASVAKGVQSIHT